MKKRVLALCLASFFSINAFALVPAGNDVTTKLPDQCAGYRQPRAATASAGGGQYRVFKRSGHV